MTLCSDGHDEVCYEGRDCPACLLLETIKEKDDEIQSLNLEIDSLNKEEA